MKRVLGTLFNVFLLLGVIVAVPLVLTKVGVLPYRAYLIDTGSMTPTIPKWSAVLVRDGVYQKGQVISFQTPNGIVTHRLVVQNQDGTLGTKGDANTTIDPSFLPPDKVIGGVVANIPMAPFWLIVYVALLLGFEVGHELIPETAKVAEDR